MKDILLAEKGSQEEGENDGSAQGSGGAAPEPGPSSAATRGGY